MIKKQDDTLTIATKINKLYDDYIKSLPDQLNKSNIETLKQIKSTLNNLSSNIGLIIDQDKGRGGVIDNWKNSYNKSKV